MTQPTQKVLFVCHNHPSVRPGGAENYAYELFESFESSTRYEPTFLAKGGRPLGYSDRPHEGTVVAPVGSKPNDYFYFTDGYQYDWLNGTLADKDFYTQHLRKFLEAVRPDVVHFQHTLFLGYDVLRLVRNVLPDAVIVYTLHEYSAICHRDGQMLKTRNNELCEAATPRMCHECFPEISAQEFFLRKRRIQSYLGLVDMFVSPSRFLVDRYVAWGIPADKIIFEENGRQFPTAPAQTHDRQFRDRFAFFGQISPYKGLDVLLEAMRLLEPGDRTSGAVMAQVLSSSAKPEPGPRPHLAVHGANLEMQSSDLRDRIGGLLQDTSRSVTMMGRYNWQKLDRLMESVDWVVIPSIWWENAPLVIQEAFFHGRPVICSDIGGMAERVTHGVDGMHFRARDPRHLAESIREAASTPGLWQRLRGGIKPVHPVERHRERLSEMYDDLIEQRQTHQQATVEVSRVG